jgi:hypothetical protein
VLCDAPSWAVAPWEGSSAQAIDGAANIKASGAAAPSHFPKLRKSTLPVQLRS